MSNTQFAFIARANLPGRAALQASIDKIGLALQLDKSFRSFEPMGFVSCMLAGKADVGFEADLSDSAQIAHEMPVVEPMTIDRDCCISMVWGGSMDDLACVLIVSAALAMEHGAIVSYEGEPPMSPQQLIEAARSVL